jgi:ASC-1-like (ASCH) protein
MGQLFDKVKDTQRGLIKYRGVENLYVNSNSGNSIYDDDNEDVYVSCDPFSKLKFDDLRKVHKDQTVFGVSEKDIQNVQQYSSVDHMMRERGKQHLTPLEKQDAERILSQQNKQYREQIMQKEYAAKLKTLQYEEKNKGVLATFLRITP